MLQEIGTAIIMFLLGSVLTYFSTRWSKALKEFDRMGYAVQPPALTMRYIIKY